MANFGRGVLLLKTWKEKTEFNVLLMSSQAVLLETLTAATEPAFDPDESIAPTIHQMAMSCYGANLEQIPNGTNHACACRFPLCTNAPSNLKPTLWYPEDRNATSRYS